MQAKIQMARMDLEDCQPHNNSNNLKPQYLLLGFFYFFIKSIIFDLYISRTSLIENAANEAVEVFVTH